MENKPYAPDPQMKKFFEQELAPSILRLIGLSYPLVKIQERYNALMAEISTRYKQATLPISLSDKAPTDAHPNGFLLMGCSCENGKPSMTLFVRELRHLFFEMKRSKDANFRQVFETNVIIGYLHELDHLALGAIGNPQDPSQNTRTECLVWAYTCELTMRPLVETYGRKLSQSDQMFYEKWIESDRNQNNLNWQNFISSIYKKIQRAPRD